MAFESLKNKMANRGGSAAAAPALAPTPTPPAAAVPPPKKSYAKPAPAPVVQAEPEEIVVVEERAVASPASGGLTLFDADAAESALMAWVERDENRAAAFSTPAFPTVILTSGNSGGMLDAMQGTPGEITASLPAGRTPFQAIFIGYRMEVLLWPESYDPAKEKTQPSFSAYIGPDAGEDQSILQAAAVKYMFTKKADKAKFDDCGHPRPQLEVLVYLPKLDHLAVLRTVAHQESLSSTLKSLAKCLPDGKLRPTPVLVSPVSVERTSKDQKWKMHHLEFSLAIDAEAKKNYAAFQAFGAGAKEDAEFMSTFAGWAKTTMTDEIRERLKAAAAL